jgi:hypothetical protein
MFAAIPSDIMITMDAVPMTTPSTVRNVRTFRLNRLRIAMDITSIMPI